MNICEFCGQYIKEAKPLPRGDEHWNSHPFETVVEARKLRQSGQPVKVIARQLDVSVNTINDWLYRGKRTTA